MVPEYSSPVETARQDNWGTGLMDPQVWEKWGSMTKLEKAEVLGAASSCPVVLTLAEDPDYGTDYQIKRYGSVNSWYVSIKNLLKEANPALAKEFGKSVDLSLWGGIQKHDSDWVPEGRKDVIAGPATYYGFVIPRLIIDIDNKIVEQMSGKSPLEQATLVDTQISGAIEDIVASISLDEAIVKLANRSRKLGYNDDYLRKRILDDGYAQEVPKEYIEPLFSIINAKVFSHDS